MEDRNLDKLITLAWVEARVLIGQQNRFSYPFRHRLEHTKRVLKWAQRLQTIEGGDLEIITLAVIFHDTGWDEQTDHALLGAELARKYLLRQGADPELVSRVGSAIETHNKRKEPAPNLPLENLIVMDADRLDELGVTTLVWDAMSTALADEPSFKKVLGKSQQFFTGAKDETHLLQTKTGLQFYCERLEIWELCLAHLAYELGESDAIAT